MEVVAELRQFSTIVSSCCCCCCSRCRSSGHETVDGATEDGEDAGSPALANQVKVALTSSSNRSDNEEDLFVRGGAALGRAAVDMMLSPLRKS